MSLFDFHHHHSATFSGIYNLTRGQEPVNGFFSAGIHPKDGNVATESDFIWLEKMMQHPNCLALGECGLDGFIDVAAEIQLEVFEKQIEIANSYQKPLIIHCVKRFDQVIQLKKKSLVPMIIHGYNKRTTIGQELEKHDFYLSFGKSLLHNVNLQEFVSVFPTRKLFLETDDSDVDLRQVYQKVADIKKISLEELSRQIGDNLKYLKVPVKNE